MSAATTGGAMVLENKYGSRTFAAKRSTISLRPLVETAASRLRAPLPSVAGDDIDPAHYTAVFRAWPAPGCCQESRVACAFVDSFVSALYFSARSQIASKFAIVPSMEKNKPSVGDQSEKRASLAARPVALQDPPCRCACSERSVCALTEPDTVDDAGP